MALAALTVIGLRDTTHDRQPINLADTNLTRANLTGANLTGAVFTGAHLAHAVLDRANLRGANLTGANLIGANLIWADLAKSNLTGTLWPADTAVPDGWRRTTEGRLWRGRTGTGAAN